MTKLLNKQFEKEIKEVVEKYKIQNDKYLSVFRMGKILIYLGYEYLIKDTKF